MEKTVHKNEIIKLFDQMSTRYINQIDFVEQVFKPDKEEKRNAKNIELEVMVFSVISTCRAIQKLAIDRESYYSEIMMLTRSVFERVITFCYLNSCSDEESKRYSYHSIFADYHTLNDMKKDPYYDPALIKKSLEELRNKPLWAKAKKYFDNDIPPRKMLWTNDKIETLIKKIKIKKSDFRDMQMKLYTDKYFDYPSKILHGSSFGIIPGFQIYASANLNYDLEFQTTMYIKETARALYVIIDILNEVIDFSGAFESISDEFYRKIETNYSKSIELLHKILSSKNIKNERGP